MLAREIEQLLCVCVCVRARVCVRVCVPCHCCDPSQSQHHPRQERRPTQPKSAEIVAYTLASVLFNELEYYSYALAILSTCRNASPECANRAWLVAWRGHRAAGLTRRQPRASSGQRSLSLSIYLHTTFFCVGPRTEGGQGLAGTSMTLQTPWLPLSTTSAWTTSMQTRDRDSLITLRHRTNSASPRAI